MYCKNCGKELSFDAKFCSECGTKVEVERPAPKAREPLFFAKEAEAAPAKPKRVVHLEEFNWDLDGYPTTPKKTEDVDFNWTSVLEEKARNAAPRIPAAKPDPKEEEPEVTVDDLVDALPENEDVVPTAEAVEELTEEVSEDAKSLEEEIFEDIAETNIDEPTKLIDKSQMKVEGVDKFYTFNKNKAEFQAMLDEEFDRIQRGAADEDPFEVEKAPVPDFLIEEEPAAKEPAVNLAEEAVAEEPVVEEVPEAEPVVEETISEEAAAEESVVEEPVVEEPVEETIEETAIEEQAIVIPEPELVAVVWASAPAGIIIEEDELKVQEADAEEPADTPEVETAEVKEEGASPSKGEEDSAAEEDTTEKAEEPEHKLTFDDVFRDDEDDDEEKEKGGCLKALAIILCILVVIELAILGVQYFAPDSQAGKLVDQGYRYVVNLINGLTDEEEPEQVETEAPTEIEQIIDKQMEKNENLVAVEENPALVFELEDGNTYGYDELPDTYAFQNSPWYDGEDGHSVTFGDEIIGTLIQYYSALSDRMNDVNKDVFDFVDNTSAFYEELEAIEGAEDREYSIQNLEIGEIRTGGSGFYVITRLTTVEKGENEEQQTETQIVYLEPNTSKKEMKIIEIQKN